MRIISLFTALILITSCATANYKSWSKRDKALMGTFTAGQAINYGQTVYVNETDGWHEINFFVAGIYDRFGAPGLIGWKLLTTAGVYCAADRLPKYRTLILGLSNAVVWGFVGYDMAVGVGWKWGW